MSGFKPTVALSKSIDDQINGLSERRVCARSWTLPGIPRHGMHQGIPIPRPQCNKAMNSKGSGGPARTRTWDRWLGGPVSHDISIFH